MKYASIALLALLLASCTKPAPTSFKEAFAGKFLIGTAVNTRVIDGADSMATKLIKDQFSALVAENCMKGEVVQPKEGEFHFEDGDKLVEFAQENGITVTGHCLVWHSQPPRWIFTDENGEFVSREVLIERMRTHIHTVVGHYKGKVLGWDVVNEAINDDGSMRETLYLKIIGPDYIKLAFQFAHEADPDAELYYNDYSMFMEGRRNTVVKLIRELKEAGCRIDAVGMQAHYGLNYPDWNDFETSLEAFAAEGVKVMLTEVDISVLPDFSASAAIDRHGEYSEDLNPYKDALPDSVAQLAADRYEKMFDILLAHKDDVSRVTFWAVTDGYSWKNGWPIPGRTDYTQLIDRNYQLKPVTEKIFKKAAAIK